MKPSSSGRNRLLAFAVTAFLFCATAYAVQYISKKEFVQNSMPAGAKLTQRTVVLPAESRSAIVKKWSLSSLPDSLTWLLGRDDKGKITGAVWFTTIYATEHRCVHHLGISINPDGSLRELAITETFCEYAQRCAAQSFLGQFRGKPGKPLVLDRDINAVTGVTISSHELVNTVNAAMAVYQDQLRDR